MQFNNLPRVEVKKVEPVLESKLDIEVFPGESHKPVITFVNQENFQWGDVEDVDEPILVPQREVITIPSPPPLPKIIIKKAKPVKAPAPQIIKVPTPVPAPAAKVITVKEPMMYPVPELIMPPPPLPCPACPSCAQCPAMPLPPPPPPQERKDINIAVKADAPACPACKLAEQNINVAIPATP